MDNNHNTLKQDNDSYVTITNQLEHTKQKTAFNDEFSDEKCLIRLAEDKNYFWVIWKQFDKRLFSFCLFRLTRNHHDAEDLCSETMLKAYYKLPKVSKDTNILAWLIRTAKNTHFDLMRRHSVYIRYQSKIDMEEEIVSHDNFIREEKGFAMLEFIKREIEKFPDKTRVITQEYFFEGKSYKQLSKDRNCNEAYIRKQIFNVRRYLEPACHRYFNDDC